MLLNPPQFIEGASVKNQYAEHAEMCCQACCDMLCYCSNQSSSTRAGASSMTNVLAQAYESRLQAASGGPRHGPVEPL